MLPSTCWTKVFKFQHGKEGKGGSAEVTQTFCSRPFFHVFCGEILTTQDSGTDGGALHCPGQHNHHQSDIMVAIILSMTTSSTAVIPINLPGTICEKLKNSHMFTARTSKCEKVSEGLVNSTPTSGCCKMRSGLRKTRDRASDLC